MKRNLLKLIMESLFLWGTWFLSFVFLSVVLPAWFSYKGTFWVILACLFLPVVLVVLGILSYLIYQRSRALLKNLRRFR